MICKWFRRHGTKYVSTEGTLARIRAERALAQTAAQTPYYEGLGRDLRMLRERNHIAEKIRASLRGV